MSEIQVFDCEQGSPEWFECRLGVPTASKFSDLLAKGEGKTRRKYLLQLVGEILTGKSCIGFDGNEHTERGHAMEDEARSLYALMRDVDPQRVGFVRCGRAGASPDSLIGDDGLLEIKTKLPHLQLDVLERNRIPPEHVAQITGQLWVTGREWCDFVSYWPGLPIFILRVYRAELETEMRDLATAVEAFVRELDDITAKYQEAA